MLEDYILYDDVIKQNVVNIREFLQNSRLSFARLFKGGVGDYDFTQISDEPIMYEMLPQVEYLYSLGPTMWNKSELIRLYEYYNPINMMQSEVFGSQACRALNIKGCYTYNGEKKRGRLHYDSCVFPCTVSAMTGANHNKPSQWNKIYKNEIKMLLKKYDFKSSDRGNI